jgi:EamA domain-containing membrane protein RarD
VGVYREPFSATHVLTFAFIWAALGIYSADAFATHRALIRGRSDTLIH